MAAILKRPLVPARRRVVPPTGFSWIDRRFVREGFIELLPAQAILLYFFLVSVSDAEGLSFYADPTVTRLLKLTAEEITQARFWLEKAGLVLYRYPLYQVLALPALGVALGPTTPPASPRPPPAARRGGDPTSLQEFFARLERERLTSERQIKGGES